MLEGRFEERKSSKGSIYSCVSVYLLTDDKSTGEVKETHIGKIFIDDVYKELLMAKGVKPNILHD